MSEAKRCITISFASTDFDSELKAINEPNVTLDCTGQFDAEKLRAICDSKINTLQITNLPPAWHHPEDQACLDGSEIICSSCKGIKFLQFNQESIIPVEQILQTELSLSLQLSNDEAKTSAIQLLVLARLIRQNTTLKDLTVNGVSLNPLLRFDDLSPSHWDTAPLNRSTKETHPPLAEFKDQSSGQAHFIMVSLLGLYTFNILHLDLRMEHIMTYKTKIDRDGNEKQIGEPLHRHDPYKKFYPIILHQNPNLLIFNGIELKTIPKLTTTTTIPTTTWDLSMKGIGDSEISIILHLLQNNSHIKNLDLSTNHITAAGLALFVECFDADWFQLYTLDLTNNFIQNTLPFVFRVREIYKKNTTFSLKEITLINNSLNRNDIKELFALEKSFPLIIHYDDELAPKLSRAQRTFIRTQRKMDPYLATISFFIDTIQFVAFPFILDIPWQVKKNHSSGDWKIGTVFALSQFDFTIDFAKKFWLLIGVVSLFFLSQNTLYSSDLEIEASYPRYLNQDLCRNIYIFKIFFSLFATTFFVPVLRTLFSALDCTNIHNSSGEYTLDSDPQFQCWTPQHTPIVIAAMFAIPLFLFLSLRISRVGGSIERIKDYFWNWSLDELPHKRDYFFAATPFRSMLTRVVSSVLLLPSIFLSKYPFALLVTYLVVVAGLILFTIRSPPYWTWRANAIQFAVYLIAFFTNIMALVVFYSSDPTFPSLIYFILILPVFCIAFLMGWLIFQFKFKSLQQPGSPKSQPGSPKAIEIGIQSDEMDAEPPKRICCGKNDYFERSCCLYIHSAPLILVASMLWFGIICQVSGALSAIASQTTGMVMVFSSLSFFGICIYSQFICCWRGVAQRNDNPTALWLAYFFGLFGLIFLIFGSTCLTDNIFIVEDCNKPAGFTLTIMGSCCLLFCGSFLWRATFANLHGSSSPC